MDYVYSEEDINRKSARQRPGGKSDCYRRQGLGHGRRDSEVAEAGGGGNWKDARRTGVNVVVKVPC